MKLNVSITKSTSLQDLLDYAIDSMGDVQSNEEFIVKSLFRGFEWSRISYGNRTKLGRMFYDFSQNKGAQLLKPLGKTPQNQQIYLKK